MTETVLTEENSVTKPVNDANNEEEMPVKAEKDTSTAVALRKNQKVQFRRFICI